MTPTISLDVESLIDVETIKELMYDDLVDTNFLDDVNIDLSKFDLNVDYMITVNIQSITLTRK